MNVRLNKDIAYPHELVFLWNLKATFCDLSFFHQKESVEKFMNWSSPWEVVLCAKNNLAKSSEQRMFCTMLWKYLMAWLLSDYCVAFNPSTASPLEILLIMSCNEYLNKEFLLSAARLRHLHTLASDFPLTFFILWFTRLFLVIRVILVKQWNNSTNLSI